MTPSSGSAAKVDVRIHHGETVEASGFEVVWKSARPTIGWLSDVNPIGLDEARWYQSEYIYGGWNPNYTTTTIADRGSVVNELDADNNEFVLMVNMRHN